MTHLPPPRPVRPWYQRPAIIGVAAAVVTLAVLVAIPSTRQATVGLVWLVVLVAIGLGLYFLPSLVAWSNKAPDTAMVVVLNLVAGWTFIGWVVALVLAFRSRTPTPVVVVAAPATAPPGWYPQGDGSQRYWDGRAWTQHTTPPV